MAIQEGFFRARDGTRLFYRYQAGAAGGAPVLLLHGHGEHSGRYLKFFTQLEKLSLPIAIFDLRGCGRSEGLPVYVSRFEDYLEDVSSFRAFLRDHFGCLGAVSLFGHSLGGLIAAAWALKNQGEVSRLVLSSPLFGVPKANLLKGFVSLVDRFVPRWLVHNPVQPRFLTHDPEEVEKYRKDPLIRRSITIRLVREMLKYTLLFQERDNTFPFPVYILMAEQDFVVDPRATRRVFERLQAPAKELESFPGLYHEIFNEREQDKVFDRLRHCLTL